jgi:hypothetical protein
MIQEIYLKRAIKIRKEFREIDQSIHYCDVKDSAFYEGFGTGTRYNWIRNRIRTIERELHDISAIKKSTITYRNAAIGLIVFCILIGSIVVYTNH